MSISRLMFIATSVRSAPSTLWSRSMTPRILFTSASVRSRMRSETIDPRLLENLQRGVATDAVDVRQSDLDLLVAREIDARNTSHR